MSLLAANTGAILHVLRVQRAPVPHIPSHRGAYNKDKRANIPDIDTESATSAAQGTGTNTSLGHTKVPLLDSGDLGEGCSWAGGGSSVLRIPVEVDYKGQRALLSWH